MANFLNFFETTPAPPSVPILKREERNQLAQKRYKRQNDEKNNQLVKSYDPHKNEKATSNSFATLFVGRLSYDTTEKKLTRELDQYGEIKMSK